MDSRGVQRKLTAILSADVVGYSRLMADDDVGTVRVLTAHRSMMKTVIEGYRGRVVDSPGDNVLAEFPSVVDAVECGVVIQKELKAQNDRLSSDRRMQFRIGINLGDVIVDGDRIYGDGVNIAARLESLAEPGGICISGSAYDQIENKLPLGYQSLGPQTVKNFSKPVRVYRAITGAEPTAAPTDDVEEPPTRVVRSEAEESAPSVRYEVPALAAEPVVAASAPPSRRRAALVAGVLVALGAIGGVAAWRLTTPAPTTAAIPPSVKKPSLAVLPIVNATGEKSRDAVAAQLDSEVRNALGRLSGLMTSSESAVQPYRARSVSVSQAGRELDVRYVLDANVRIVDGRPRVVATLVDTTTGNSVWTERFDQSLTSIAAVQSELLQRIIAGVPITLTADEQAARAAKGTSAAPVARSPASGKTASPTAAQKPAPLKPIESAVESPARTPRPNGEARSAARNGSGAKPAVEPRTETRSEPASAPPPAFAPPPQRNEAP